MIILTTNYSWILLKRYDEHQNHGMHPLKLHNTSIKSISGITNLIYIKKYLNFNGDMPQVFGTLCCFSSRPFLKQFASHFSTDTL